MKRSRSCFDLVSLGRSAEGLKYGGGENKISACFNVTSCSGSTPTSSRVPFGLKGGRKLQSVANRKLNYEQRPPSSSTIPASSSSTSTLFNISNHLLSSSCSRHHDHYSGHLQRPLQQHHRCGAWRPQDALIGSVVGHSTATSITADWSLYVKLGIPAGAAPACDSIECRTEGGGVLGHQCCTKSAVPTTQPEDVAGLVVEMERLLHGRKKQCISPLAAAAGASPPSVFYQNLAECSKVVTTQTERGGQEGKVEQQSQQQQHDSPTLPSTSSLLTAQEANIMRMWEMVATTATSESVTARG